MPSARADDRPRLAITLGDPAGIGPEVVAKSLADPATSAVCTPILVGDAGGFFRDARFASSPVSVQRVSKLGPIPAGDAIPLIDTSPAGQVPADYGEISARAGQAAAAAIVRAVELALAGEVDGIVTAPINKAALQLAGYSYAGHTEMIAALTGTEQAWMLLLAGPLRIIHVSTHVSLREAIARARRDRVLAAISALDGALRDLGIASPRIAVAGLNPHAGDGGLFGEEDTNEVLPAVVEAQAAGVTVVGPEPPDTVFFRAAHGSFDGVVAMYHDQGHIPAKLLGFDIGVNATIGLPIVRTSVDHGTAFDIAGRGIARHSSLIAAIETAARFARARRDG